MRWAGSEQIIELDGWKGLIHVARRLGARLRTEAGYMLDPCVLFFAEQKLGADVTRLLRSAARGDADLRAFLRAATPETYRVTRQATDVAGALASEAEHRRPQLRPRLEETTFWEVWNDVIAAGTAYLAQPGILRQWGGVARLSDLRLAARVLQRATDPVILKRLLRIFEEPGIPGFDPVLLDLLDHADADVRHRAGYALGATRHPAIRAFALARTTRARVDGRTLGLYRSNRSRADGRRIMACLPKAGDTEHVHDLVFPLVHIWEETPTSDAADPLAWVFDRSPCSVCRRAAFKTLIKLGKVPRWMCREAAHDCDGWIRRAATA